MKILLALFPQLLSALLMSLFEEELLLGDAELEIPDERLTLRGERLVVGEGVEAVEEDPVVPHLLLSLRAHNLRLRKIKEVNKRSEHSEFTFICLASSRQAGCSAKIFLLLSSLLLSVCEKNMLDVVVIVDYLFLTCCELAKWKRNAKTTLAPNPQSSITSSGWFVKTKISETSKQFSYSNSYTDTAVEMWSC